LKDLTKTVHVGNEDNMILIVVGIAFFSALGWYSLVKRFWLAGLGSTLTSMCLAWGIGVSHMGYFDATFFKNMSIIGVVSFFVSIAVGLVFVKLLKNKQ